MRRPLLILALLLAACHEHHHDDAADRSASSTPPPPAQTSSAAASSVKITDASGKDVVSINDNGSSVTIDWGTQHLIGTSRETGKRKYALANGPVILEVKPHDNGFKVRNPNGTLLWKIKFDDNKVKVSNNEQNEHPYELRDVTSSDVKDASGNVQFHVSGGAASAGYGVLTIKDIPAMQQYVIVAEMLARHR